WKLSRNIGLCIGRHALHHLIDHPAIDDVVSPQLKKLQEEGEMGRQKINQWTRYLTVGLAGVQTSFVAHWLQVNQVGPRFCEPGGLGFFLTTVLTLTTGTIFVMWLGEQITERGVGNGISLLIFAGIVS